MFFKEKVHPLEVIKWGIFGGIIEGIFCLMIILMWLNRDEFLNIGEGWEFTVMILINPNLRRNDPDLPQPQMQQES